MKNEIILYQYGSNLNPRGPERYSPSDWMEIVYSDSSPSERSSFLGAPQVSSDASSDSDASFTELSREDLFKEISHELQRRMEEIGMKLPESIDMKHFISYNLLGEEEVGALDPSLLADVLADLQLPSPILSWYWEEAFKSILLLYNVIL